MLGDVCPARLGIPAAASLDQSALMAESVESSKTSSMLRMVTSCRDQSPGKQKGRSAKGPREAKRAWAAG
ncbi:hypothetical protein ARTHROSP310_25180 [Arthrobacter sp. AD-310]